MMFILMVSDCGPNIKYRLRVQNYQYNYNVIFLCMYVRNYIEFSKNFKRLLARKHVTNFISVSSLIL